MLSYFLVLIWIFWIFTFNSIFTSTIGPIRFLSQLYNVLKNAPYLCCLTAHHACTNCILIHLDIFLICEPLYEDLGVPSAEVKSVRSPAENVFLGILFLTNQGHKICYINKGRLYVASPPLKWLRCRL